jgi:hypothetical protein
MLLDLPDPSIIAVDPLSSSGDLSGAGAPNAVSEEAARRFEVLRRVPSPLDEPGKNTAAQQSNGTVSAPQSMPQDEAKQQEAAATQEAKKRVPRYNKSKDIGSRSPKKNSKRKMRFGRRRAEEQPQQESLGEWLGLDDDYDAKKDGRQIGSWDHFADDDDNGRKWKGGATVRAGLRGDDAEEGPVMAPNFDSLDLRGENYDPYNSYGDQDPADMPNEQTMDTAHLEELNGATLGLGDDDIIAHDIWFVGVGASAYDHAGIRAFLEEHRRDIRGAFLVNLDSIGAGNLTLLTREGMGAKRRADRRMGRMITNIADALGIELGRADYSWETTDATPAMQRSVRVSTLMGMSDDGVPAHSHTNVDEPEYLNDKQIQGVADIVAELIRRA